MIYIDLYFTLFYIYTCQIWFAYKGVVCLFFGCRMPLVLGTKIPHYDTERLKWETLNTLILNSTNLRVNHVHVCPSKTSGGYEIHLRWQSLHQTEEMCSLISKIFKAPHPEKPPFTLKKDFSTFADRLVCLSDSKCNILRYIWVKLAKIVNFFLFFPMWLKSNPKWQI